MTCLFCNIVNKKIPATIVYESDTVIAFNDISPQAPTHILVIPKQHINNILGFTSNNATLLADLFSAIQSIAKNNSLDNGFRVVTNTGVNGGQTVNHIHFHILGGRILNWPPG